MGMVGNGVVGLSPKHVMLDSISSSIESELLSDESSEFVSVSDQSTELEPSVDELSASDVSIAEANGATREYMRMVAKRKSFDKRILAFQRQQWCNVQKILFTNQTMTYYVLLLYA